MNQSVVGIFSLSKCDGNDEKLNAKINTNVCNFYYNFLFVETASYIC